MDENMEVVETEETEGTSGNGKLVIGAFIGVIGAIGVRALAKAVKKRFRKDEDELFESDDDDFEDEEIQEPEK